MIYKGYEILGNCIVNAMYLVDEQGSPLELRDDISALEPSDADYFFYLFNGEYSEENYDSIDEVKQAIDEVAK